MEYFKSSGVTVTKHFFAGGANEVEVDSSTTPATETITRYYSIAGTRIAMNDGTAPQYLINDHLSSTSLVLDASGNKVSEQSYTPWGGVRTDVGIIGQTDFGYTGQRNDGAHRVSPSEPGPHPRGLTAFLPKKTYPAGKLLNV